MKLTYPEQLPVSRHRDTIREAVANHQVVIVCGDTGSGKTTQLPKIALELDRQHIGCTQPRRIAATSVAKRVADELRVKIGEEVGYQIRFEDRTSRDTRVKFMTDGILLAETQGDPTLRKYDTLIIDEAHERSLNIDFILGYLHRILKKRRDLKVIISSATLDAETFADFFGGAPVIQVEGRTFPVEDHYQPPTHGREPLAEQVLRAAEWLGEMDSLGDTLVFLPGEREIRDAADLLAGRKYPNTLVLPLFARQAGNEQQAVFKPTPRQRRIVLATNVAETSLTIPDIRFVIDSGIARVNRYDPRSGIQRLQIEPISKASARQRRGRCGRVSEGVCVRLYDEEDFESRRPYTDPEILRSNLSGVVLQMEHLRLGDPLKFPFIDPPQPKRIAQAYRVLEEIGAIRKQGEGLTDIGHTLARLPLDPRVGRILIEAEHEKCLREALIVASALTVQDPRERPEGKREAADQAHAKFRDKQSDFTGWLRVWYAIQQNRKSNNSLRRFCRENFFNYRRTQEWMNLHRELRDICRDLGWKTSQSSVKSARSVVKKGKEKTTDRTEGTDQDRRRGDQITDPEGTFVDTLHKCVLAAIPSQIGYHQGKTLGYKGARDSTFWLHPGSGSFGSSPKWLMAFEMVETAKLYARNVSQIDPAWFEKVAPHLCRYRYTNPHWVPEQGAVYAEQAVIAYGLCLVEKRRVHFGKVDPAKAREVFIWEALVNGNTRSPMATLKANRKLLERVRKLEHKVRRRDGLMFPQSIFEFYDERLPKELNTQKAFEKWASEHPDQVELTLEDCIVPQVEPIDEDGLPDKLDGVRLTYAHNPSEEDDGITAEISLGELPHLPDWFGEWLVPGWLPEKLEALLRSLDKNTRKLLPPVSQVVGDFLDAWKGYEPDRPFETAILDFIRAEYGEHVDADAFDYSRVADHLWMRFKCGKNSSRSLAGLREALADKLEARFSEVSAKKYREEQVTSWSIGDLPAATQIDAHTTGIPALYDAGKHAALRLFPEASCADWHHPRGLARLFRLVEPKRVADFEKWINNQKPAPPAPKPKPAEKRQQKDSGFGSLADAFGGAALAPAPAESAKTGNRQSGSLQKGGSSFIDFHFLGQIGRHPATNRDDFLTLVIIDSLPRPFPRTATEFGQTANPFDAADRLSNHLSTILESVRVILGLLDSDQPGYAESIADAQIHLDSLLRPGWLAQAHSGRLAQLVVEFQGLETRLTRMFGSPPAKDLAKLERFQAAAAELHTAEPRNCNCGVPHPDFAQLAAIEAEADLRLHHFAPELRAKRKR